MAGRNKEDQCPLKFKSHWLTLLAKLKKKSNDHTWVSRPWQSRLLWWQKNPRPGPLSTRSRNHHQRSSLSGGKFCRPKKSKQLRMSYKSTETTQVVDIFCFVQQVSKKHWTEIAERTFSKNWIGLFWGIDNLPLPQCEWLGTGVLGPQGSERLWLVVSRRCEQPSWRSASQAG